mmetsp:Transcript_15838/g.39786  ORF Transcript_15838/g.39786 Transcript_15838/m.39786 type:complete len:91 (-) Transcript_15838:67-339(-)
MARHARPIVGIFSSSFGQSRQHDDTRDQPSMRLQFQEANGFRSIKSSASKAHSTLAPKAKASSTKPQKLSSYHQDSNEVFKDVPSPKRYK